MTDPKAMDEAVQALVHLIDEMACGMQDNSKMFIGFDSNIIVFDNDNHFKGVINTHSRPDITITVELNK